MKKVFITIMILMYFSQTLVAQDKEWSGIFLGLSGGTWFPDSKNKVLGNPIVMGLSIDFKPVDSKGSLGFSFEGVEKHNMRQPLTLVYQDSTFESNGYSGVHFTVDYSREIVANDKFLLNWVLGVGSGEMVFFSGPTLSELTTKCSIIINPGLDLRYKLSESGYLQLRANYYLADYGLKNDLNLDFRGNYLVCRLAIGFRIY